MGKLDSPSEPSFVLGYWRPWDEKSNYLDSYLNYLKDVTLAKYTANTVGQYITRASEKHVAVVNKLGAQVGLGFKVLSSELNQLNKQVGNINKGIAILNQKAELQLQQQRVSNLLLADIGSALRIPDSEKERIKHIEYGSKYFVNAKNDPELFSDSLEHFLAAEKILKQDPYSLFHIGMIYMFSINHVNAKQALEYFERAARYAKIDSNDAVKVDSKHGTPFVSGSDDFKNTPVVLEKMVDLDIPFISRIYSHAAFAAYILGDVELSCKHQENALQYHQSAENHLMLAKYCARARKPELAAENLKLAVTIDCNMFVIAFRDIDLINDVAVLRELKYLNDQLNEKIEARLTEINLNKYQSIREISSLFNDRSNMGFPDRSHILQQSYDIQRAVESNQDAIRTRIQYYKDSLFALSVNELKNNIDAVECCLDMSSDQMMVEFNRIDKILIDKKIKLGFDSKHVGGYIFYVDEQNGWGLVSSGKFLECKQWGSPGRFGTKTGIGQGKKNTEILIKKASYEADWKKAHPKIRRNFWMRKIPSQGSAGSVIKSFAKTEFSGFKDWFIPSKDELLKLIERRPDYKNATCIYSSSEFNRNPLAVFIGLVGQSGHFEWRVYAQGNHVENPDYTVMRNEHGKVIPVRRIEFSKYQ